MNKGNTYKPESVSHPGVTLLEKLEELNIGPKEFAIRTGKPEKTISHIISGTSSITADMAVLFENVLRISASFWLKRQNRYDEFVARTKRVEILEAAIDWARNFPYAAMAKLGWIAPTRIMIEQVENLFSYFSMSSPDAFSDYYFEQKVPVSFRISLLKTNKPYAFASWLRQGEIQALKLSNKEYNKVLFKESLPKLKSVMASHPDDFFQQIQAICLNAGVKVVYTPCLPGAAIHGSTRWIADTPLIQLSARYKQNDIFWFTFFHEVGHILLHGKKCITLEKVDYEEEDMSKEEEADEFAIKWTFSKEEEETVLSRPHIGVEDIIRFASEFGTHPGMIIGRFHHKGLLHYSEGRKFIQSIDLAAHA